jgi:two-component system, LytTR family, response regulator
VSIRALIVDDEPYARERLRELCALEPDVAVVGEASHGLEAIEQVEAARPNLLLLDVQMRGTNGFEVLDRLTGERPLVVFVSAYDQYALAAFAVEAVDYLLKPFDRERFRQAIRRVRSRLSGDKNTELADRISTAVRETVISVTGRTPPSAAPKRIVAERDGRMFFIAQPDIDSVEANRNYVNISAGTERFTLRWTMQQAEGTLDSSMFLRVHRSVIVNTHKIREMERRLHGEYVLTLAGGQKFTSGRAYRRHIQAHLKSAR